MNINYTHLKQLFYAIILLCMPAITFAQIGGDNVYEFLTVPTSARAAALGGSAIAINDADLTISNDNPALLNKAVDGKFGLEYINYIADINLGRVAYAHNFDNIGMMNFGIQYINSGEFTYADNTGSTYGTFTANEFALNISYAKTLDSLFSLGATIKPVYSQLENYNSLGILMDVGAAFTTRNRLTTVTLLLRNMGGQLTTYDGTNESVPFDIQLGFATKLEHAPFRFSIVAHDINHPTLTYSDDNVVEETNIDYDTGVDEEEDEYDESFLQNTLRHFIFGVEFLPSKSFFVRAGLNVERRQELKLNNVGGSAGFSWGFGFRISKFHLSYANVRYHVAGSSNNFTITTNLNDFFR